jgi:uncharacterized protein (DUF305 family)
MNNKSMLYRLVGVMASGAIAAGLIGCSTQSQETTTTGTTPVASPKAETTTQVDRRFIEMMIPHHEGAVDMAELALNKAKRPEIKQFAEAIKKDQAKEIQQMQAWYKQWYGKDVPAASAGGMDHSMHQGKAGMDGGMMGMMEMDVAELKKASDFDREFIKQMIPHHQSAVMMAQMVVDSAEHPEIRNLAQAIVKSQNAEIEQMQKWQQAWYR